MKINEVTLTENQRIPTGVGRQTVFLPWYSKSPNSTTNFHGDPEKYPFSPVQRKNYEKLKQILAQKGIKLREIWASTEVGDADYIRRYSNPNAKANLTRFVVIAGPVTAPTFVWEKYEGSVAGGGRNTVYHNGIKEKLTDFLEAAREEQMEPITANSLWRVEVTVWHEANKEDRFKEDNRFHEVHAASEDEARKKVRAHVIANRDQYDIKDIKKDLYVGYTKRIG